MLPFLLGAVVIAALAAYTDLRRGLIPNALTFAGLLAGMLGHLAYGWHLAGWRAGLAALAASAAGALLCALAPTVLFLRGCLGGGDVKLFAALGACCQPLLGIEVQLYSFILAAAFAPARLAYEGRLLQVMGQTCVALAQRVWPGARRRELPVEIKYWIRLGPAVLGGMLITLLEHAG
jgi:prepilin peptidase CpaA